MQLDTPKHYSVLSWIEGLPRETNAYVDASQPFTSTLKIAQVNRRAVSEISVNAFSTNRLKMQDSPSSQNDEHATPARKRTKRSKTASFDEDDTPGANPSPSPFSLPFQAPQNSASVSDSASSASQLSASLKGGSSVTRLADLRLTQWRVTYQTIGSIEFPLPNSARCLATKIRRVASGRKLIPISLKPNAEALIKEEELDQSNFEDNLPQIRTPGAFSDIEIWIRVDDIQHAAAMCDEDFCAEPAWNAQVHSPLLGLALRGWRETHGIWYYDVSTARIDEKYSKKMSKVVDYSIVLIPGLQIEDKIIEKLLEDKSISINHSNADHIRYKPIAISIETKRPGTDESGAKIQLEVWAGAHFERLQRLCGSQIVDQILPQIIVQGHDWRLKIASMPRSYHTVVHGDWVMGDTRTKLGIYKIIAAIQVLSQWATDEYKPWFLKNALGLPDLE